MINISLVGQTKVSTLQKRFKNDFGLTLRIYEGRSFADPNATLGQIRKKQGAPKIGIRRNTKIGNLEAKFLEEAGIKVQIAGSDDSYLCNNDLTLAAALAEDELKLGRKKARSAAGAALDPDNEQETGDNDLADEFLINAAWEIKDDRNICRWMVVWKTLSVSSIAGVLAGYSGGGAFQLEQFVANFSGGNLTSLMIDTEDKITGDEIDFFDDVSSDLLEICDDAQDIVLEWNDPDEWEDAEQLLLQEGRVGDLTQTEDLLVLEKGSSIFLKDILEHAGITAAPGR
ncbi:MAG: hypothetical protein P8Q48_25770 [Paracoccaceae bacterium]|nr:hypothetical protein [Paracoccaceae bacterium]